MNITKFKQSDLDLIKSVATNLSEVEIQLNALFPERQWQIRQILYCLVTARNMLIYGTHGTAKSLLASTVFKCISGKGVAGEDKQVFIIQLDNESTLDELIGPTNIPELEKGHLAHAVDGFMPTAHFVFLDEFFEALSVLRSINDMLNEKQLRAGQQTLDIPLMTAIATTNRSPEDIQAMYPQLSLASTNDRFLCVSKVDYLDGDTSLDTMLENFVSGVDINASVPFADLQRVSRLINSTNQFPDTDYLHIYRSVMSAYNKKLAAKPNGKISDRRIAWLTQMVEATAVLNGRVNLYLDDILSVRYGLCPTEAESKLFMDTATPILEKVKVDYKEHIDENDKDQLVRIEAELNDIQTKMSDPAFAQTNAPAGIAVKSLARINRELKTLTPKLDSNVLKKNNLMNVVATTQAKLNKILENAS